MEGNYWWRPKKEKAALFQSNYLLNNKTIAPMTIKKDVLLAKVYKNWMDLMLNDFPLERIKEIVKDDVMGYGTTLDEKILSIGGLKQLVNKQREQGVGLDLKWDLEPVLRKRINENTAIYVDEALITMHMEGVKNKLSVRLSTVFGFSADLWKVTHWHGSVAVPIEGDTWHKDELKLKNEALEKLVEEKTADLMVKNRELEIEIALERVRARTISMQHSDELSEISSLLDRQIRELGIKTRGCAFNIYDEKESTEWFSSEEGTLPSYKTPRENVFLRYYDAGQRGESLYIEEFAGEACAAHYDYLMSLPVTGEGLKQFKDNGGSFPARQIDHAAFFKYGYLLFITLEPVPEAHTIFKRFALVFEQTYTRFLDLKKAEAQTREAQIEAALEKIRSSSLAMHKTDDLGDVVSVLFEQLQRLDVDMDFGSVSIFVFQEDSRDLTQWIQLPEEVVPISVPYFEHSILSDFFDAKEQNKDYFEKVYTVEEKNSWAEMGFEFTDYKNLPAAFKTAVMEAPGYAMSIALKKNSGICIPSFVGKLPPKENIDIMKRVSMVFEQAYIRFLDLKKAELQAQQATENLKIIKGARAKAEKALKELKAAQSQLIQSEKMASLGELTAGIAHEIKNPLNFVNNFSEVSVELIDEALEELELVKTRHSSSPDNESLEEITAILNDVKGNLTKVHEHGTRADGIVKSMLQHSRGGSGKMEPTNLNALVKEYVNLAFHGMRAGKNPINAEIDLQLDPKIKTVPMIGEDFSRVVLNLCNNAFDAMRETVDTLPPKLSVRTKLDSKSIHIEVEDNGSGIPEEIKDKILQPFFTTKKGTDGTGLGLSITNDIIKAHGGQLDIQSQPGQTIFKIHLTP
jgi:signal transduction histidine kinase